MSAAPASSIRAGAPPDRLPELSRLAALFARTVLDAQIQGRPVPDDQIRFLLDAALLLNEYGAELPSPLDQIMQDASAPKASEPSADQPAPERFAGIIAPSISHEGYSAKPMHSYWDNFWALRGYKDAADIAAAAIGARVVCGTSAPVDDGSALVRTPLILAVAGRATSAADNRADAFAAALEDALRAGSTSVRARIVLAPGTVIPALEPTAEYERAMGALIAGLRETIDLVGVDEGVRGSSRRGADGRRVAERPLTRVVAALRDDHRLVAHAERMLDPLLAERRARGGDLLDVLTALLAHPSNRTAAAEAAHLSRSVFYQRIALIQDLLGVDLDDGEVLTALHFALLVRRSAVRA